uniref:Uncharacterized protein n=1 Tax=Rhizophagus irregularis (strain DAOM 181602 / DAOM 197198 / MUCL 43194) TaxID=747089 RepID=U9TDI8_RHIID
MKTEKLYQRFTSYSNIIDFVGRMVKCLNSIIKQTKDPGMSIRATMKLSPLN